MSDLSHLDLVHIRRIPIVHGIEISDAVVLIAYLHRFIRQKQYRTPHLHKIRLRLGLEIHLSRYLHIFWERLDLQYLGRLRIVTSGLLSHNV